MFYPVESLKRGGRFYLCWVADSWPLQFATITHRQLFSQDIRVICDDLLEVISNESGRPTQRFSLRLSSQLLRGLVRLYQKKVTVYLGELCMLNANVIKNTNKKWCIRELALVDVVRRPLLLLDAPLVPDVPEDERRVEELIQNSGNVVANIQDITLKESVIPDILLPPNDNFGEEHPEQPLQLLQDRTLELMLRADAAGQHSGLDIPLDLTDKSHDKSRIPRDPLMETIGEHDLTLFRKSTGLEYVADFDKDIPAIPDISEIPNPDLPVPLPEKTQEEVAPVPETPKQIPGPEMPVEIELEELESEPQAKRRRQKDKLIIDKRTQLSSNFLRSRIDNHMVELRCEDSLDDIISIRVPAEVYLRRPCHGGHGVVHNIGFVITRLFMRNLGTVNVTTRAERETEVPMQQTRRTQAFTTLERIEEVQEPLLAQSFQIQPIESDQPMEITKEMPTVPQIVEQMDLDIADIPTQIVEVVPQVPQPSQKRTSESETYVSPKRQRSGYVSFKESQQAKILSQEAIDTSQQAKDTSRRAKDTSRRMKDSRITSAAETAVNLEADKENIPDNIQVPEHSEQVLSSMLQEAGLADIQIHQPMEADLVPSQARKESRKTGSERSETPLGSLDRTKVSLGDSEHTTDSKRFIHDQWGTEGTMTKILKAIKAGMRPVTVETLLAKGPVLSGHKRLIAARCFSSILKLKQHCFINIYKDPDTLEVKDITLGQRLTSSIEEC